MNRRVLGLDINDEFVAATVIAVRGQEKIVTAAGLARFEDRSALAEVLPSLLEQVGWKEGTCVCGISLAGISLRNIAIPFTESRKIAQILPLELEDQLMRPARDQLVEYSVCRKEEDQSHLLVAALEKERLKNDLEMLGSAGLNPGTVTLRTLALAKQLQRHGDFPDGFVLVEAGVHSAGIAVVVEEQVVFMRRLAYPDRAFTSTPFVFDDAEPRIANPDEALEFVNVLCGDIQRSLGLYQLEGGLELLPERIILSGSLSLIPEFREKIESALGTVVETGDLLQLRPLKLEPGVESGWRPGLYDHSLALALQGLRKKTTFNFRKDEFAPPKFNLASKNHLLAAAGLLVFVLASIFVYLGYDYRVLYAQYNELGSRMKGVFKETFPGATRIVDPLLQMKTNLRNVQAPSIATPIFSGDKRALNILADISGRIPTSVEIHVDRFVIDQGSVVIKGRTNTYNNVNLIQGVLRESPFFGDVAIVSAAAEKDSGQIRFELKLQMAGTSS